MVVDKTLLSVKNLKVVCEGKTLLEKISFDLKRGQIITVVGPNGAGKTTLIRALLGVMDYTEGDIERKQGLKIGYVPQRLQVNGLMPLTVKRFITLAEKITDAEIEAILHEVRAEKLIDQQVHTLSGGEWQRVLLARALARKPELLVLDEPAQGMDINGQVQFYENLQRIQKELNCGILMVSHDLHMVMSASDEVLCINRHVCCAGKPEDISKETAFIELFGERAVSVLAPYHHEHSHSHGWPSEQKEGVKK